MPIGDLLLSLLLAALAGMCGSFARWVQDRALSHWLAGWGLLNLTGAVGLAGETLPRGEALMHPLGPLMPALTDDLLPVRNHTAHARVRMSRAPPTLGEAKRTRHVRVIQSRRSATHFSSGSESLPKRPPSSDS